MVVLVFLYNYGIEIKKYQTKKTLYNIIVVAQYFSVYLKSEK